MPKAIKYNPTGGMNLDDDVRYLNNGDYRIALGIRHVSDKEGNSISIEDVLGNEFVFSLGEIAAQNKIFRMYVESTSAFAYAWLFSFGNGVPMITIATTSTAGNITQTLSDAQGIFMFRLNQLGQTYNISTVATGPNAGYVQVEVTTVPGWEYDFLSVGAVESRISIIQEAHDLSMIGENIAIGGFYLLEELWLWTSNQKKLPEIIPVDITNISDNGSNVIAITTSAPHGLTSGSAVTISATPAATGANGTWIIQVIAPNTFLLLGSFFTNPGSGGTITTNVYGVGSIIVAKKDINTQNWTAVTVLSSKELNLRVQKQLKVVMERNAFGTGAYFTDDYNSYRTFYYDGPFVTNGAIQVINPMGRYAYGSIAEETLMILGSSYFTLTFTGQSQFGGNLKSGNKRYAVNFLDEELTETPWTPLGNPISTFKADTGGVPANLYGDDPDVITPKVNNFVISNIIPGLFKYVQLAVVEYIGGAISGYIVGRFLLTGGTTQNIQHTGFETTTMDLDIGLLLQRYPSIDTGLNIDLLDNRAIISNVTLAQRRDFSMFAQSLSHRLLRTESANGNAIPGVGTRINTTLRVGEFQDPMTVHTKAGYMLNETYRISAQFELITGSMTDSFWVDDIRFDDFLQGGVTPFNRGNPFGDNRRIASLPSMDLTDPTAGEVYSHYVRFENINWYALVDGIPIKNLVRRIHFNRVEMTENFREVIAGGIAVQSTRDREYYGTEVQRPDGSIVSLDLYLDPDDADLTPVVLPPAGLNFPDNYADFMWAAGGRLDDPVGSPILLNPTYNPSALIAMRSQRRVGSFYSMDLKCLFSEWLFLPGDKLITFGSPVVIPRNGLSATGIGGTPRDADAIYFNQLREFSGYTNHSGTEYNIVDGKVIQANTHAPILNTGNTVEYYKRRNDWAGAPSGIYGRTFAYLYNPTSPVYGVDQDIVHAGNGQDFGVLQAQIYRAKVNKFGPIGSNVYIPTGSVIEFRDIALDVADVFGGDVMTQKSHILQQGFFTFADATLIGTPDKSNAPGLNGGIGFYSQNHVNSQMINMDPANAENTWSYPAIKESEWLNKNSLETAARYNHGYNLYDGISAEAAFDAAMRSAYDLSATMYYSLVKPSGSLQDRYRIFLPLNRYDFDQSKGEITHHAVANGELYVWQTYDFRKAYFSTNAIINTQDNSEIVVGDGAVMRGKSISLSSFGLRDPYAVVKGRSNGGKTTFYWPSSEYGKFIRFGMDGTVNIVDIKKMRTLFKDGLTWTINKPNPAYEEGTNGVWDDMNMEAIFVIRAKRGGIQQWNNLLPYNFGAVVEFQPATFSTFEQTGEFYMSIVNNNIGQTPGNGPQWQLIPHTDRRFYNEFCIAFSEWKNQWTTFYPFLPRIMFAYANTFLSPRSTRIHQNRMYEYNRGELLTWFNDPTDPDNLEQAIDGYIDMPANDNPNANKDFQAYIFESEVVPHRVELRTDKKQSYLLESDFEYRKEGYASTIKKDSTVSATNPNGLNDVDGQSQMYGTWMLTKLFFKNRVYQKLYNFLVRLADPDRSRDYRT